ncbi:MAG TPA: hypothetical protein PKX91_04290 [Clostridia bacterium]|jgi:hypothetical protein|nr:hypothetical protein [Clostridia bacterium]
MKTKIKINGKLIFGYDKAKQNAWLIIFSYVLKEGGWEKSVKITFY